MPSIRSTGSLLCWRLWLLSPRRPSLEWRGGDKHMPGRRKQSMAVGRVSLIMESKSARGNNSEEGKGPTIRNSSFPWGIRVATSVAGEQERGAPANSSRIKWASSHNLTFRWATRQLLGANRSAWALGWLRKIRMVSETVRTIPYNRSLWTSRESEVFFRRVQPRRRTSRRRTWATCAHVESTGKGRCGQREGFSWLWPVSRKACAELRPRCRRHLLQWHEEADNYYLDKNVLC